MDERAPAPGQATNQALADVHAVALRAELAELEHEPDRDGADGADAGRVPQKRRHEGVVAAFRDVRPLSGAGALADARVQPPLDVAGNRPVAAGVEHDQVPLAPVVDVVPVVAAAIVAAEAPGDEGSHTQKTRFTFEKRLEHSLTSGNYLKFLTIIFRQIL